MADLPPNARILFAGYGDACPDLTPVYAVSHGELGFDVPDVERMTASFAAGRAVVLEVEGQTAGYYSYEYRLGATLRQKLGVGELPDIMEAGNSLMVKEYRGRGLYTPLRDRLTEIMNPRVQSKEILVIGTTKNYIAYKVSKEGAVRFDYDQRWVPHLEYPMIAALTCICTPDYGCGFQLSSFCPARATAEQLPVLQEIAEAAANGVDIPCVMHVSDPGLARSIDDALRARFSGEAAIEPQAAMVAALKAAGYYG